MQISVKGVPAHLCDAETQEGINKYLQVLAEAILRIISNENHACEEHF
ncbi:MAG: hypothetical protein KAR40_07970 [Candidatus Sabulitectum sp.]|nr:hypothetical protein [Candidatus Sabulitectum sp.]